MFRYLAAAFTVVVTAAACGAPTPTAPSVSAPPVAVPPAQPTGSGPAPISGTPIVAGSLIQATVGPGDPECFPNWDSRGHCRQFDFTASSEGTFRVTLKSDGPSRGLYDLELFVVSPDGAWVYSEDPWPDRYLRFHGSAGQTYRIVVIGYQSPQGFEIVVEVH